jgi:hypothetical protein
MNRKSKSWNPTDLQSIDKENVCGESSLDEETLVKINALLDQFPDPPALNFATSAAPSPHQSSSQSANAQKTSSNGWGSWRGIAEKFNVFKST